MLRAVTHSNSRPSSEEPGFSPAYALRNLLALVTLCVSSAVPHAQVQGTPQAPAPPAVGTGLIAGQVADQDTGRGIAGAQVTLTPRLGPAAPGAAVIRPAAVAADSQGRFYFGTLRAGGYAVMVQAPGHTQQFQPRIVELADGARVTDVKVNLRRLGSLTGRVLDDSGTPVVSVEMLLLTRLVNQGRPPALMPAMRTRTNDRGEYRFAGVPEGDYLVCACLRGDPIPFDGHLLSTLAARPLELLGAAGRAVTAGSDAVSLDGTLKTLPITFYPAATLASQAERVRMTAAEDKTGVDVTMTAVRASRVSGRIVGATSSVTAAHLRLRVMSDTAEAAGITQIVPMLVQPDGRFDFANVPPGQYVLEVNFRPGARGGGPTGAALVFVGGRAQAMQPTMPVPTGGRGGPVDPASLPLWAQEILTVGDRDITGLVVPLNPTLTVSGRVTFSGSAAPPNEQALQRISAVLSSVEIGSLARSYFGQLQPDRTLQFSGVLPGKYVLSNNLAAPPWMTLKSVTTAGDDLTDATITVDGDLDMTITLTDVILGSVTGRVGSAGAPEGDPSWLRVFPVERKYWPEPYAALRRFRTVTVAPDGRYFVTSLPAGDYYLIASSQGGSQWMDASSLETLARTAERVRVNDGDKLVFEVRR